MKKLLIVACFICLPLNVNANALALLRSFIDFYRTEVAVIIEKLNNAFGSASSLLAADKAATTTLVKAQAALYKSSQGLRNTLKYSSAGQVGEFKVGGITPSGCLRSNNGDISADIMVNVIPYVDDLKLELNKGISQDGSSFRSSIKRGKNVASIIVNNAEKDKINPFNLNRNISLHEAKDLADIIQYIVNSDPPDSSVRPNTLNNAQYHSKRLRYELFVHIIESAMMNRVSYYIRGNNGESEKDYFMRLLAKANSSKISESMVTKYEAGSLREVNGTLSDLLSVELKNKKIRQDIIALTSILATGSTDDMAEKL